MNEKILKDDPETPWLKDMISYALQQKRMDFEETKKQFFNKGRKVKRVFVKTCGNALFVVNSKFVKLCGVNCYDSR